MAASGEAYGDNHEATFTVQPLLPGEVGFGDRDHTPHLSDQVDGVDEDAQVETVRAPIPHPKGGGEVTPAEKRADLKATREKLGANATLRAARLAAEGFPRVAQGTLDRTTTRIAEIDALLDSDSESDSAA